MKKFLNKAWPWALTLLLGVWALLFWWRVYPHALAYHEQMQLFLFDNAYLQSRWAEPGGAARWVAELLTQFYNSALMGACVLALLYMLTQRLAWRLMQPASKVLYPLSFIPTLLIWYAMGDQSTMLAYPVALALVMAAALAFRWVCRHVSAWLAGGIAVVGVPIVYWLAGPLVLFIGPIIMLTIPVKKATLTTGLLALGVAIAAIALSTLTVPYPAERLWVGLSYYRLPLVLPSIYVIVPIAVVVLTAISKLFPQQGHHAVWWTTAGLAAVLAAALLLVPRGYDAKTYELIEYDYLVRTNQWDAIIQKAQKQQPDLPMSVSATNLALAMKGQLGDRAYEFYQHGSEGLLPPFERNYATTQLTGEIYFQLGLVNTAQRFAFEAMEALPNYNKSGRSVKRLAEANIVNGQYDVARKYLKMLQKTIFYRPWAQRMLALMANEEEIDAHPLYGRLRRARLTDEFLFSEQETDKICGQLFIHYPQNTMAMQYLVMMPLLDGDAERFVNYLQVVRNYTNYNPRCVQQALGNLQRQQRQ